MFILLPKLRRMDPFPSPEQRHSGGHLALFPCLEMDLNTLDWANKAETMDVQQTQLNTFIIFEQWWKLTSVPNEIPQPDTLPLPPQHLLFVARD